MALRRRLGLPDSLRDLGVPREQLREAVADAPQDRYYPTNPAPIPSLEVTEQVLDWAWSGRIADITTA